MPVSSPNWQPLLLALLAAWLTLQGVAEHQTCVNEERWENQMMCEDKEFGCRVPYPDNCNLFLVCDCLYPTVMQCPATLYWNNDSYTCDYPQDTECIYYTFTSTDWPTTTAATTKQPTTTPSSGTSTTEQTWPTSSWDPPPPPPGIDEGFCKDYPNGSVHRYPYDCNAYINCTHNWPVLNYCEFDKVFNPMMRICDTPDTAKCEPLPLTTTSTAPPLTTTTEDDGQCSSEPPEGIEEDYCVPLGNGFYEYQYNCSAYISCRNGCTNLAYCIPDKLFNPILHICDTPDAVKCHPSSYTTTTSSTATTPSPPSSTTPNTVAPSTTSRATTPGLPPGVDPDLCVGKSDYTLLPYAPDCSQYLQCEDNQVILGQCPKPKLFNPDLLVCDNAKDVYCYGDRTTSTSTASTTAEPTTTTLTTLPVATTAGPEQLCADEEFGATYPYVENCSKYIFCVGDGSFRIVACITGTYFDPQSGECGNVSPTACKGEATTEGTTTVASTSTTEVVSTTPSQPAQTTTTTTEAPVQPDGICGGKLEGEMIAYPKDCGKYIVCVTPIPIAFYCMEGYYFSVKQQACVAWSESDCDRDMSTTTPGYNPTPAPTICTNSSRDTFPYPENCQWFVRCVDDYVYMMDVCNHGEYYDPISGACGADVPHDACRWDYTSTPTAPTTTAEPTPVTRPPPQKGPCDDTAEGELVPYPNDCSKYIKCDRPIAAAFDCQDGYEFSPVMRVCMEASLANCNVGPATDTTPNWPSATTTTLSPSTTDTTPTTPTTPETSTTDLHTTPPVSTTTPVSTTMPVSTTPEATSTTTTTELTTTPAPPDDGICGGKPIGSLVPYPNNCGKFIICQEPIPIGYDCDDGLEFSPIELKCMEPDLAKCETDTTAGPSTPSTAEPITEVPSSTTTVTERTTVTITTEATTSSPEPPCTSTPETTATTPQTTKDITTTTTTPAPPTTTTINPNTPNICCGQALSTILPYPNDCNRYVICDYPIPIAVACQEGYVFDIEYLQCNRAENVTCIH